jgi:hypothetical protein
MNSMEALIAACTARYGAPGKWSAFPFLVWQCFEGMAIYLRMEVYSYEVISELKGYTSIDRITGNVQAGSTPYWQELLVEWAQPPSPEDLFSAVEMLRIAEAE